MRPLLPLTLVTTLLLAGCAVETTPGAGEEGLAPVPDPVPSPVVSTPAPPAGSFVETFERDPLPEGVWRVGLWDPTSSFGGRASWSSAGVRLKAAPPENGARAPGMGFLREVHGDASGLAFEVTVTPHTLNRYGVYLSDGATWAGIEVSNEGICHCGWMPDRREWDINTVASPPPLERPVTVRFTIGPDGTATTTYTDAGGTTRTKTDTFALRSADVTSVSFGVWMDRAGLPTSEYTTSSLSFTRGV